MHCLTDMTHQLQRLTASENILRAHVHDLVPQISRCPPSLVGLMEARLTVGLCVSVCSNVLTLSLAIEANLLAPTVKQLQPWNTQQTTVMRNDRQTVIISELLLLLLLFYWVDGRHGIIDEVFIFLGRLGSVSKPYISIHNHNHFSQYWDEYKYKNYS